MGLRRMLFYGGLAYGAWRLWPRTFGRFVKPLKKAIVSGGWGDSRPASVGSYHYAIDIAAQIGDAIAAARDGEVVAVDTDGHTSAGKFIVTKADGVAVRYLHLSRVDVSRGDQVSAGQHIGLVGTTGFSSGPHLHLDVFLSDELVARYRQAYGEPVPKLPAPRAWGTQVPAESFIPVDGYTDRVRKAASERNVSLET